MANRRFLSAVNANYVMSLPSLCSHFLDAVQAVWLHWLNALAFAGLQQKFESRLPNKRRSKRAAIHSKERAAHSSSTQTGREANLAHLSILQVLVVFCVQHNEREFLDAV